MNNAYAYMLYFWRYKDETVYRTGNDLQRSLEVIGNVILC